MTKEQETVITFLLSKNREMVKNLIQVDICRSDFNIPDMTEEKFISILSELEAHRFIDIKWHTGYCNDLKYYITVVLLSPILNYFENKKDAKIKERNQWIQFWIPVSLSVIAIIISIITLLISA